MALSMAIHYSPFLPVMPALAQGPAADPPEFWRHILVTGL